MILMDGDGEDRPDDLPIIIKKLLEEEKYLLLLQGKKIRGSLFQILYEIHKVITLLFAGKNMNFGHYCCLTKRCNITIPKKTLWSNLLVQ